MLEQPVSPNRSAFGCFCASLVRCISPRQLAAFLSASSIAWASCAHADVAVLLKTGDPVPVFPGATFGEIGEYGKVGADTYQRVRTVELFTTARYDEVEGHYRGELPEAVWVDLGGPLAHALERRLGALPHGDQLDDLLAGTRLLDGPVVIVTDLAATEQHLDPPLAGARTGIRVDVPQSEALIPVDEALIMAARTLCRPSDDALRKDAETQARVALPVRELTYLRVQADYCDANARACTRQPTGLRCQAFLRGPRGAAD